MSLVQNYNSESSDDEQHTESEKTNASLKRPITLVERKDSENKKKRSLPKPPAEVFDKFRSSSGVGSVDPLALSKISQEAESVTKNSTLRENMSTTQNIREINAVLRYYFYSDLCFLKPQISRLSKVTEDLNSKILRHNFGLTGSKLESLLNGIRTGDGNSYYHKFYHSDFFKTTYNANQNLSRPENLFKGNTRTLILQYNNHLKLHYKMKNIKAATERYNFYFKQKHSSRGREPSLSQSKNILFQPNFLSKFGTTIPLHISLTQACPIAPLDLLKDAENAIKDFHELVRRYNKCKQGVEDEEVQAIVGTPINKSPLTVSVCPKLVLVPNRYFTRLFVALSLDEASTKNLNIVKRLINGINFFGQHAHIFSYAKDTSHISFAQIDLCFNRDDFNIIFAEQLWNIIDEANQELEKSDFKNWDFVIDNVKSRVWVDTFSVDLA